LKLGKLPNRTPVKLTVTVPPELFRALRDYAACYHETYKEEENVIDLIPCMLRSFLESDRDFSRWSKPARSDDNAP
jgi:hypothetical protein